MLDGLVASLSGIILLAIVGCLLCSPMTGLHVNGVRSKEGLDRGKAGLSLQLDVPLIVFSSAWSYLSLVDEVVHLLDIEGNRIQPRIVVGKYNIN